MNKIVRGALIGSAALVGVLSLSIGGAALWAITTRDALLAQKLDISNAKDVPVPWPLTDAEIAQIRAEKQAALATVVPVEGAAPADPMAGVDLSLIAKERAVERGKHLVTTIYGCTECHGEDFGGHVVVDSPLLGAIVCPNITTGKGSVTLDFKPSDWDRIIRHGVRPDGSPTVMPAVDFQSMSDRELSDIVSYVRSFPPVDKTADPVRFGPLLTVLTATGEVKLSAFEIDHTKDHALVPPEPVDPAFGEHLTMACRGCHGSTYSGGPIKGGDPAWPPAANLTQLASSGWTEADFARVMREGKKKDGSAVQKPMPWEYYKNLDDKELAAMWAYVSGLKPVETGVR